MLEFPDFFLDFSQHGRQALRAVRPVEPNPRRADLRLIGAEQGRKGLGNVMQDRIRFAGVLAFGPFDIFPPMDDLVGIK